MVQEMGAKPIEKKEWDTIEEFFRRFVIG